MYVIQSNINHQDFQSMMYKVTDLTWEEYKEYFKKYNVSFMLFFIKTKYKEVINFGGITWLARFSIFCRHPNPLRYTAL
jgi:CRISPR/Cas system CMR subunit Cmr6 (Cas7 group RAMP superfamily)